MFVFKYMYVIRKRAYPFVLATAALLKAGFLFFTTYILIALGVLPVAFILPMGVMQLATAFIGGAAVYPVLFGYKKLLKGKTNARS